VQKVETMSAMYQCQDLRCPDTRQVQLGVMTDYCPESSKRYVFSMSYTCWWYSFCNFQYRPHDEKTGSRCCIGPCRFFFLYVLSTMTSYQQDSPFFFNTIGLQVPKRRVPAGDSATIEDVSEHCTVPLFYLVGRSRRDHVAN
jgi:hypothetical protein